MASAEFDPESSEFRAEIELICLVSSFARNGFLQTYPLWRDSSRTTISAHAATTFGQAAKKKRWRFQGATALVRVPVLLQQLQYILLRLVGLSQSRKARLLQDVVLRQV
jgi:hypothetical protein